MNYLNQHCSPSYIWGLAFAWPHHFTHMWKPHPRLLISLWWEVWVHKTSLTLPLFKEKCLNQTRQVSGHVCVFYISNLPCLPTLFLVRFWNRFHTGIFGFSFYSQYWFFSLGFSLDTYLQGKGLDPNSTTQLTVHLASQLLHDIGVAPALLDTQCNRDRLPYYPFSDEVGWNKGKKKIWVSNDFRFLFCFVINLCWSKINMKYPSQKNITYERSWPLWWPNS